MATEVCPRHGSRYVAFCLSNTCPLSPECCVTCMPDHYSTCDKRLLIDLTQAAKKTIFAPNNEAPQMLRAKIQGITSRLDKFMIDYFQKDPQLPLSLSNSKAIRDNYLVAMDNTGNIILTKKTPQKVLLATNVLEKTEKELDAVFASNIAISSVPELPKTIRGSANAQGKIPPPLGVPPVPVPPQGIQPKFPPYGAPMGGTHGSQLPPPMGLTKPPSVGNLGSTSPQDLRVFDASILTVVDSNQNVIPFRTVNNKLICAYGPGECFVLFKKHLKLLRIFYRILAPNNCPEVNPGHSCLHLDINYIKEKLFNNGVYTRLTPEYQIYNIAHAIKKMDGSLAKFNGGYYVTVDEPKDMFLGSHMQQIDPAYRRLSFGNENYHLVLHMNLFERVEFSVDILDFEE